MRTRPAPGRASLFGVVPIPGGEAAQDARQGYCRGGRAWLVQRSPTTVLIPGTSSLAHLRENLGAASLTLPDDAIAELNTIGH